MPAEHLAVALVAKVCLARIPQTQTPICERLADLGPAIKFARNSAASEQTRLALADLELRQRLRLAAQADTAGMALAVVEVVAEVQLAALVESHLSTHGLLQLLCKLEAVQPAEQVAVQELAQPHFTLARSLEMELAAAATRVLEVLVFVEAAAADLARATLLAEEGVVLEWSWCEL